MKMNLKELKEFLKIVLPDTGKYSEDNTQKGGCKASFFNG